MTDLSIPELYADYLNNFLTLEAWADHYGLTYAIAYNIMHMARLTDNFSKPLET